MRHGKFRNALALAPLLTGILHLGSPALAQMPTGMPQASLPDTLLNTPSREVDDVQSALGADRTLGSGVCVVNEKGRDRLLEPCTILLTGSETDYHIYTLLDLDCNRISGLAANACYRGSVVLSRIDGTLDVDASEFEIESRTDYTLHALNVDLSLTRRGVINTAWTLNPLKGRYVVHVDVFDAGGTQVGEENWDGRIGADGGAAGRFAGDGQLSIQGAPQADARSRLPEDLMPAAPPPPPEPGSDEAGPTCKEYADHARSQAELVTATAELVLELLGLSSMQGDELIAELDLDAEILERLETSMDEDLGSKAEGIGVAARLTEGLVEQLGAQGGARLIRKISTMYDMRGRIENFSEAFANYTWQEVNIACKKASKEAHEQETASGEDDDDGSISGGYRGDSGPLTLTRCEQCVDCREKFTDKSTLSTSSDVVDGKVVKVEEVEVTSVRSCICARSVIVYVEQQCEYGCNSADDCIR